MIRRDRLRALAVGVVAVSLLAGVAPAGAATSAAPAVTRIGVRAAPSTVHVGAVLVVSGSVTPRVSALPVVLQRLVGRRWVSLRSTRVSTAGSFSFLLRASAPAALWQLRVARVGSPAVKAGASATLNARVTTAIFTVRANAPASVAAGSPVIVTGSVTPRAAGTVTLQRLQGRVWRNTGNATLSRTSAFRLSAALPTGRYQLRVVRPFTPTVAGGISRTIAVAVLAPPPPPQPVGLTVTTKALPAGTVGRSYTTTLGAAGGAGPYTWAASTGGLPAGLALTSNGRLWGYPTVGGTSSVRVSVRNAAGITGTANLPITIAAAPAGAVWGWGDNKSGELGNGNFVNRDAPVPVGGLTGVIDIASNNLSGYALRADGSMWAWGYNGDGQLGNGQTANATVASGRVTGLTGVTAIAAGGSAAYALLSDGTVWAWGRNSAGQLGDGTTTRSTVPVKVSDLTGVVAIAAGNLNGYALRADGTLWSWGDNMEGQLGNGGTPAARSSFPVRVTGLTDITAVAGGAFNGYALRADGTVAAWGSNNSGQLGTGSLAITSSNVPVQVKGLTSVSAIASVYFHAFALRSDGTVYAWGYNVNGQLGVGSADAGYSFPVQVGTPAGIATIAASWEGGYAIGPNATAWSWGGNNYGQLGNGTKTRSLVPVPVSDLKGVIAISGSRYNGYAVAAP